MLPLVFELTCTWHRSFPRLGLLGDVDVEEDWPDNDH